jgi:NAD(P)-dependent dehydrogenase (short-subunit alcohol dehydrogenase family)
MECIRLRSWLSLEGKVALVAGGSGGIGAATVAALAAVGARVVAADLAGRPGPPGAEFAACDLKDPAAIRDLVERVRRDHGRLDVLVHAAGIARDAVIWKMTDAAWSEVMQVNLESAFHLVRSAIPLMRAGSGGSIVLIASINGERGKFGQANYAASKAGLIALARSAASEVGRFGVRVNAVAPGWIETPLTAGLPAEARARAESESLLGRLGTPDDVARVVLFLATPLAAHVTGQVVRVDGGQLTA